MDNTYANHYKRARFMAVEKYHILDIVLDPLHKAKDYIDERNIGAEELTAWLKAKSSSTSKQGDQESTRPRLRVITCTPKRDPKVLQITLPFTLEFYEKIEKEFAIDQAVLGYLVSEGNLITEFNALDDGYGVVGVLKKHRFVVTYDPASLTTSVLVIGLCPHGTAKFCNLIQELRRSTPTVTAIVVAWENVTSQYWCLRSLDERQAMLDIEDLMGLHENKYISPTEFDFDPVGRTLLKLSNSWNRTAVDFHLRLVRRFSNVMDNCFIDSLCSIAAPSKDIKDQLRQLIDRLEGLQSSMEEIQKRADIALQTILNGMSQRDNENNYDMAVASKRIAEAQRDLAQLSYQDSVYSRLVAMITLFTLPGTVTATFFSQSFFNFKDRDSSAVVSPWIWLFFVVTLVLTGALFITWHIAFRTLHMSRRTVESPGDHAADEHIFPTGLEELRALKRPVNERAACNALREKILGPHQEQAHAKASPLKVKHENVRGRELRTWYFAKPMALDVECAICFDSVKDEFRERHAEG